MGDVEMVFWLARAAVRAARAGDTEAARAWARIAEERQYLLPLFNGVSWATSGRLMAIISALS